jgi:hypothetical protein
MAASNAGSRIYVPARGTEDWQALLADPEKHWRPGYSAHALATTWQKAQGFPKAVRAAFAGSGRLFEEMEPLLAIPGLKTPLPPARGRSTQTDLFVLARTRRVLAAIAVGGKVAEPFGQTVRDWLGPNPSDGKRERLNFLCQLLQLPPNKAQECRYELLHRTAAALIEAERFMAQHAVMLVHSFSPDHEGFAEFAEFAKLLGAQARIGDLASTTPRDGILLHLGWVADRLPRT